MAPHKFRERRLGLDFAVASQQFRIVDHDLPANPAPPKNRTRNRDLGFTRWKCLQAAEPRTRNHSAGCTSDFGLIVPLHHWFSAGRLTTLASLGRRR
jgi:hypothetical protein